MLALRMVKAPLIVTAKEAGEINKQILESYLK
jgi:hypothetical protein